MSNNNNPKKVLKIPMNTNLPPPPIKKMIIKKIVKKIVPPLNKVQSELPFPPESPRVKTEEIPLTLQNKLTVI